MPGAPPKRRCQKACDRMTVSAFGPASAASNTRPMSARACSTVKTVGVSRPRRIRSGSRPSLNVLVTDIHPPTSSTVAASVQAR